MYISCVYEQVRTIILFDSAIIKTLTVDGSIMIFNISKGSGILYIVSSYLSVTIQVPTKRCYVDGFDGNEFVV